MDLFGLGAIISGILNFIGQIGTDAMNYTMNSETNASNERNVAATNDSNERNVAATNAANLQIQREVNETNAANVAATNATNKQIADEANQLQFEMAETAYQRSTAKNQISELVRAGYSEQQAKMLVAGSLSPATYQPFSPAISEMQTPVAAAATMQASQALPFQAVSPRFQGAQFATDLFTNSYAAPDGGVLGAMMAENPTSVISQHLHEMRPLDYSTPSDFMRFAQSDDAPDWAKELVSSSSFKNMNGSILGQRAYRSWLRSNSDFNSWSQEYENKTIQNRISAINERISGINLESAGVSLEKDKLELQMGNINLQFLPLEKDASLSILQDNVAISSLSLDEKARLHEQSVSAQSVLLANNVALSNLGLDQRQFLHEMTKGANLASLKRQMAHDELDLRVYDTPEYRDAYVNRLLQDEYAAGAIGLFKQYEQQGMLDLLQNDPDLNNIYIIGKSLSDAGITDEDLARGIMAMPYKYGKRDSIGYGFLFGYLTAAGAIRRFQPFAR